MRLTPKGLLRWYADCCRTPVGNTLPTRQVPFVGMIHSCIDQVAKEHSLDASLGPVRARVNARFAIGDRTELAAYDRAPLSLFLLFAAMFLMAQLRGEHKKSPFFNPHTGEPSATPNILSENELRELERVRDKHSIEAVPIHRSAWRC
jgi:hypothetical protein